MATRVRNTYNNFTYNSTVKATKIKILANFRLFSHRSQLDTFVPLPKLHIKLKNLSLPIVLHTSRDRCILVAYIFPAFCYIHHSNLVKLVPKIVQFNHEPCTRCGYRSSRCILEYSSFPKCS